MSFDPNAGELKSTPQATGGFDPNAGELRPAAGVKDVDFSTGLSFTEQMALSQMEGPEFRAFLEKVHGKENVVDIEAPTGESVKLLTGEDKGKTRKTTSAGFAIKKDGKLIAVAGGSELKHMAAEFLGQTPTTAGAALGAAEGGALGAASANPWGLAVGIVGGAIIGGVVGKSAEEIGKSLEGNRKKDLKATGQDLLDTALASAEGEVGGRILSKAGSRLSRKPLPDFIRQSTPQNDQMTERLLDAGARPNMKAVNPGAKRFQWMQSLAQKTVGGVKGQDTANEAYIRGRIKDALTDSGMDDLHADATVMELSRGDSKVPTAEVGEAVQKAITAHKEILESNVKSNLNVVNKQIDSSMNKIDILTRRFKTGELGIDVPGAIKQARQDFGTSMSKVYDRIDAMVGDKQLVPTNLIRSEARRIARKLPQSVQSPVTKEMAALKGPTPQPNADDAALFESLGIKIDIKPGQKITFADAQRARTILREKADDPALTRGMTRGEMQVLANAFDNAIGQAAEDPIARPAVAMLRAADQAYAKGIAKFKDATINRLVRDMESGIPADSEKIASMIIQSGQEARVKTIKGLVGPEVWQRVAGADYSNMIRASTDETGAINGIRLMREIANRKGLMTHIYGDKASKMIEDLAKTIAARDGKIDVQALNPGVLKDTVAKLKLQEDELNKFMKESYVSQLTNPRGNPQRVYTWLTNPGNEKALSESIKLLGENSPQVTAIRQTAMKQLLTNAKMTVASGLNEEALSKALAQYSPKQQEMLFPHGQASDLHLIGKEIEFLMKDLKTGAAASLAAGMVTGGPIFTRIPLQIGIGAYQVILSSPKIIRYLSTGLRGQGPVRKTAKMMLMSLVRHGSLSANQNDSNVDQDSQ